VRFFRAKCTCEIFTQETMLVVALLFLLGVADSRVLNEFEDLHASFSERLRSSFRYAPDATAHRTSQPTAGRWDPLESVINSLLACAGIPGRLTQRTF
jgi:hypothetical protein